jgi:hypothetical protein
VDDGSGLCKSCGKLSPGCYSCSFAAGTTTCSSCIDGFAIASGSCYACDAGCQSCTVSSGTTLHLCVTCFSPDFSLSAGDCLRVDPSNTCDYTVPQYYSAGSCLSCVDPNCQTCYDGVICTACKTSFEYIMRQCMCNAGLGMFLDHSLVPNSCISCQAVVDTFTMTGSYLTYCRICQGESTNYANQIECL